jgi:hypothetical protein
LVGETGEKKSSVKAAPPAASAMVVRVEVKESDVCCAGVTVVLVQLNRQ